MHKPLLITHNDLSYTKPLPPRPPFFKIGATHRDLRCGCIPACLVRACRPRLAPRIKHIFTPHPNNKLVHNTLVQGRKGLRPDYAARWNETLTMLGPLIANGSAMGVFLGDELCWNCVTHAGLTAAANLVRATLPVTLPVDVARTLGVTRPIIYYNEAFPPLDDVALWNATCGPAVALTSAGGGYPDVPTAIDWFSIDYYPNEGTFLGVQRIYHERIFPRMQQHQRVLFVPPAFACSPGSSTVFADKTCCNNATRDGANPACGGDCQVAQAGWARAVYDWARAEQRFVGINPWYWEQPGAPAPSSWLVSHKLSITLAQHLDSRCVLLAAPLVPRVPTKTRLEPSMNKYVETIADLLPAYLSSPVVEFDDGEEVKAEDPVLTNLFVASAVRYKAAPTLFIKCLFFLVWCQACQHRKRAWAAMAGHPAVVVRAHWEGDHLGPPG